MLNTIRENAGMVNHQSRHASVFSVHISAGDLVFCKDMERKVYILLTSAAQTVEEGPWHRVRKP